MKRLAILASMLVTLVTASSAHALDILVCNDDGFTSANTRALYEQLVQDGHPAGPANVPRPRGRAGGGRGPGGPEHRIRQRVTASPNLLRALALKTNAVVHVAQLEGRDALGGEGQPLLVTRPHRSGETLEVSSDGTAATED